MTMLLKIIKGFFITLGVIFFILIIIGAYLFIADPFEIKPIIKMFTAQSSSSESADSTDSGGNSMLSAEQKQALEEIGVNPSQLPQEITPAMEDCFVEKLGAERVNQIKAGDEATTADYWTARGCL